MRILFVASEGLPFSKTGGLADVVEALPKALVSQGHDVAVVLPRYRTTQIKNVVIKSLTVPMGTSLRFPAIADGGRLAGVQYFFVDDPQYFDRDQLYGVGGRDYPDNAERFAEFARASIELAKQLWLPDVIHCHDWQSALVPVLLRTAYAADPQLSAIPVVFTIHNMGYHGLFPRDVLPRIGLPDSLFRMDVSGILRPCELSEGRSGFQRLLDYRKPQVCAGDSDHRIRARLGWRGAHAR